jgi:hypothetical protein
MYALLYLCLIVFVVGWVLILNEVIPGLITILKDYMQARSPSKPRPAAQKAPTKVDDLSVSN